MSERPPRSWLFYIDDMIQFATKVITYTEGLDQDKFVHSGLNYDATLSNLELIGEAASHVPDEVRGAHPEVPWRLVVGAGGVLLICPPANTAETRSAVTMRP